jgi:hypothetical protein
MDDIKFIAVFAEACLWSFYSSTLIQTFSHSVVPVIHPVITYYETTWRCIPEDYAVIFMAA